MTTHASRVGAAIAAWNAGDLARYLDLYDDRIRLHGFAPEPMDKQAVRGFYRDIWASLPEVDRPGPSLEVHEELTDGDRYACRFTMRGVHTGEFLGAPATGRRFELAGMTILRFDGPRVVERWSTADFLGMLTQLGVIGAPA
jgi:predicted ester cyclase